MGENSNLEGTRSVNSVISVHSVRKKNFRVKQKTIPCETKKYTLSVCIQSRKFPNLNILYSNLQATLSLSQKYPPTVCTPQQLPSSNLQARKQSSSHPSFAKLLKFTNSTHSNQLCEIYNLRLHLANLKFAICYYCYNFEKMSL